MTIVTVGDGGVVTLPADILRHLGVTGAATLEVEFLPGKCLALRLPKGTSTFSGLSDRMAVSEPVPRDEDDCTSGE